MGRVKVLMMECDAPACYNRDEHSKEQPATGFHLGKGFWVSGGGGPIPALYACSLACITPAIDHAIQEELNR